MSDSYVPPHLDEAAEDAALDVSDVRPIDWPGLALFAALAFVVFLQFFTRYVLNSSLGWTEEIARYLLIGVTFVGCVTVTRKSSHIAVELLQVFLSEGPRGALTRTIDVTLVVVYGWFAWVAAKLAMRTGGYMVSIDLPKSIIYWTVAVSLAVMAAYQLARLFRRA